jgi:hypothetical protein
MTPRTVSQHHSDRARQCIPNCCNCRRVTQFSPFLKLSHHSPRLCYRPWSKIPLQLYIAIAGIQATEAHINITAPSAQSLGISYSELLLKEPSRSNQTLSLTTLSAIYPVKSSDQRLLVRTCYTNSSRTLRGLI